MLVLSRRTKESIMIGDNIKIVVTKITARTVRLGIQTPDHTSVVRLELLKIPIWCKSEKPPCHGLTPKQLSNGEYQKCLACQYCDLEKLPAA